MLALLRAEGPGDARLTSGTVCVCVCARTSVFSALHLFFYGELLTHVAMAGRTLKEMMDDNGGD